MSNRVKRMVLVISKLLGLFSLAKRLTRRRLRILCYHGFALVDENRVFPKLFMRPASFADRLRLLQQWRFPVLSLDEAVARLREGSLPDCATVLTFDDGWYGFYQLAWPEIRRLGFPATVYVTSYYVAKREPVFGVLLDYMCRMSIRDRVDFSGLAPTVAGEVEVTDIMAYRKAIDAVIKYGEEECDELSRGRIARAVAERVGIEYEALVLSRRCTLMTPDEIKDLANSGVVAIESHTHRHRCPEQEAAVRAEITDNRDALEPLTARPLRHFCYPDGEWSRAYWPWLTQAGMVSATTCDPGLNHPATPLLALHRFLDGENVSQIEFEAEMCGYQEMLRHGRQILLGGFSRRKRS